MKGILRTFRTPFLVLALIVLEVVFKFDSRVGFFAYLITFIAGIIFVLVRPEKLICTLLILPLIRIVGVAVPLAVDAKLLFISAVFFMLVILHVDRFSFSVPRWKKEIVFVLGSIIGGAFIGLFLSPYVLFQPGIVVIVGLFLAAVAEELYFRISLLSFQKTLGMLILVSLLYAVVVFDASFVVSFVGFFFSFFAGFFYLKYGRAYIPILVHIVLNIFLVLPKFF
ncbi:MAG: CPBP family glutamic-type intramembrane protease [Nanoarchaeota archaeon]